MKNELHDFITKLSATTLNVSMAILILMPQGWAIIAAILLLEAGLFYLFLKHEYKFKKIFWRLTVSNLVSGISGFILSLVLNGGWLGVFWFPWIGSHEIQFMSPFFILYFFIIFAITLLIEIPINIILFRKLGIHPKQTFFISLSVNAITNIGCAFIIYLFSFNIIKIG
ncbi:hypothetical protein HMPREF1221_00241 [Treponema socranskii subsp. paredis ATCC 35535]|nr:hypothetical protein HMPREF1221_00241 [Treponema socranskii subsp. paredis ATCC 35535]